MEQALDCGAPINAAAARAAGYVGVFRYLYNLTIREIESYHAEGLWVALIAEFDTLSHHPIHDGYPAGLSHGRITAQQMNNLNAPKGLAVFATADDKVFNGQGEIIMGQYCDGFRDGLRDRALGALYGGAGPVKWAYENGHAKPVWVAGASYWDNGVDPATAHAVAHQLPGQVKVNNLTCDVNDLYDDGDWGQWWPVDQKPPTPLPPTKIEENTVRKMYAFNGHIHVLVDESVTRADGSVSLFSWHYIGDPTDEMQDLHNAGVVDTAAPVIDLGRGVGQGGDPNAVDVLDRMWQRWAVLDGPDKRD